MTLAEIATRNRAATLAQLARLRPAYHEAKAAEETLYQARQGTKDLRAGIEQMKRLKYVPGFFPTPRAIVDRMLDIAGNVAGKTVLEPSAGKGNIADVLREANANLLCVELNRELAEILRGKRHECICGDFLTLTSLTGFAPGGFYRIIMNPPFERRQDLAHIQHAHTLLSPGGRLVAICSSSTAAALDTWTAERSGYTEPLEPGSFRTSERPTGVNCALVVAEK